MPRVLWTLHQDRPSIEITLVPFAGGPKFVRTLLADSGAGNLKSRFHIFLTPADCRLCRGIVSHTVNLSRAYRGPHPVYVVRAEIPALGFRKAIWAVAVDSPPLGFDGSAGFRFLNQFTYGNFGDKTKFGLEL
jgi:hypothetical protein